MPAQPAEPVRGAIIASYLADNNFCVVVVVED
jgi:hypothetical protein